MASVASADQVKTLREVTGAGIMDCKQALAETGGDLEKAKDFLRKKGLASAEKRASREAKEGLVFVETTETKGALLELNCETDFVARTDAFQALGQRILTDVLAKGEAIAPSDAVTSLIQEASGKIGEKLALKRAIRFETSAGLVASYRHHNHRIGILVELGFSKPELAKHGEALKLAKDIAMQIAALRPQFLKPDEINPDFLEREKSIFREQVKGKPENVQEKIIQGKLEKRFEDICLLNQKSVLDNSKTIAAMVKALGEKVGDAISVKRFVRFEIGFE